MRSIKKNVVFLGLAQGLGMIGDIVMVAMTARYLGVVRFGEQSVLRATAMFALPLFAGGLNIHIVRAIARDPEGVPAYLGSIVTLRWALSLGAGLTVAVLVRLLPLSPSMELASYAAILLGLSGIWVSVPRAIFMAYERNEYNLLMGAVTAVLSVALTVVAVRLDTGVAGTLMAGTIATFLVAGVAQALVWRRMVRPRLSVDVAQWREIMRSALPLGISGVLRRSYTRIDVWLLAALAGTGSAALFSVAYRVALQAAEVSRLLSVALLPRISSLAKARREVLGTVVEGLLRLLMVISIGGAGLAAACALPLLMLIVGPKFAESVVALRLVSIVCVTALPSAVLFLVLVALGREKLVTLVMAVTVAWNAAVDAVLIPRWGVTGACYGTISAEWVYFTIAIYLVQKELQVPGLWRLFGKLLLSGAAMAAVVQVAGAGRPVFGAIGGMAVFVALCLALRIIPRGSVRRLRVALRSGGGGGLEPMAAAEPVGATE